MPRPLYKYRSLSNFQYFEDIILNNRLYATIYSNQNDSDEGFYFHTELALTSEDVRQTYIEKNRAKMCSLSKERNHRLLWGHYADGGRGVNIALEVNDDNLIANRNIIYEGLLEYNEYNNIPPNRRAIDILSRKMPEWEYEREKRYFTYNDYISVDIKEIILGSRINPENEDRVRTLVADNNPNIIIERQP